MKSRWNDSEARACIERYASQGEDVALRVYSSRLIGADPALVLHGGGNTSVKSGHTNLLSETVQAIFVKGSGWNLDTLEPEGLPGLDLAWLRRLRVLSELSDEEMVNQLRTHLFDASAPNPSVETLLHAFLPPKFIDHSHADAILALTNRPDGEAVVRDLFGVRVGIVRYVMPGFQLALRAAEAFEAAPEAEGLVLLKHGLFTWGATARESYERHIALVDAAEKWLEKNRRRGLTVVMPPKEDPAQVCARIAPLLRGRLALPPGHDDRPRQRMILDWRATGEILEFAGSGELRHLAESGPLTPDHVIRTKPWAMVVENPSHADMEAWCNRIDRALEGFRTRYERYFQSGVASRGMKRELDPLPRVILIPGVGLFTAGAARKDARIAADLYEHTIRTKALVHATGDYEGLPDLDLFDMEYWSLEQAKLGKAAEKPLARRVAAITGAGGAIGFGVATRLLEAGAHVMLLDNDAARLRAAQDPLVKRFGGSMVEGLVHDVTDEDSTAKAFDRMAQRFGGVDIVVPNAGIAMSRPIALLEADEWRRVQEVNATGVFLTVRAAARMMKTQGTGGHIVIIGSKNVMAPGAEFAAYSASKASATQLGRVAAMELAGDGIRVNLVAPDAVFGTPSHRSGLWDAIGPERAKAQGVAPDALEEFYRNRNLLKARVSAEQVGSAVVFLASDQTPTTGAVIPVDGGVPGAFPR